MCDNFVLKKVLPETWEWLRVLLVLMWKNWTVRKRRYITTPIELVAPSVFLLLLFWIRNNLDEKVRLTNIQHMPGIKIQPSLLLYVPETPLTNILMDEVGRKLKLPRLIYFPDPDTRGYYAINNKSSMQLLTNLTDKMRDTSAIIIFQYMQGDTWPMKLNYTIRMKIDYMTRLYRTSVDEGFQIGPHQRTRNIYEPFMRLQWAIDSSYLKLLTGDDTPQEVEEIVVYPEVTLTIAKPPTICLFLNMSTMCFYSLLLPFIFLMSRLVEERASGVQELVKMVGVSDNLLGFSHFLNMMPEGLVFSITGALLTRYSYNPMFPMTKRMLVFVALILFYISIVSIAFACSYITLSTTYTTTLSILSYVMANTPSMILEKRPLADEVRVLTGLLPFVPIHWFWEEVVYLEHTGDGVTYSTMWDWHDEFSGSVFLSYVMMVLQIFLFFLLSWYLSKVRPGAYGVASPWNFCFKRSFWSKKLTPDKAPPGGMSYADESIPPRDSKYFEDLPANAEVGIKVVNVSKEFGTNRALSNVSLDVLKGKVTVLLGHNGAGKTTLMSIITGMCASSGGKVYVNGSDIAERNSRVRRQIGLCPENTLVFPALNVLENVMVFALLKGESFADAKESSIDLLDELGIIGKATHQPSKVSLGVRRRLQLACALSGGATILVLDEPTAGLDLDTRRDLWDLLLSLRGDKTVLITTHFIDEADALADRVVALHGGQVRCHATPMFLKKSIGTGYRLTLSTIDLPKESEITSRITSIIPKATLTDKSFHSVTYSLPEKNSKNFSKLFGDLESNRSELEISSIGVGVSTLEEVFLKLCSDVNTSLTEDIVDANAPEPSYRKRTGILLYFQQAFVLVIRHLRYFMYWRYMFASMQVIMPITMFFLITFAFNIMIHDEADDPDKDEPTSLDIDRYEEPQRRVLYNAHHRASVKALEKSYGDIKFQSTGDVAGAIIRSGNNGSLNHEQYLAGVDVNSTDAKVLYTMSDQYAAPVTLNILSNILAAKMMPWADGKVITTNNHPLKETFVATAAKDIPKPEFPKNLVSITVWSVLILFIILGVLMMASTLAIMERKSGTRHIHMMSGCPPPVYWLARLLCHTVLYIAILILPAMAACYIDKHHTLNQANYIRTMFVILLLGCMAFLSFVYFVTFMFDEQGSSLVLAIVVIFFGLVPGVLKTLSDNFDWNTRQWELPFNITGYVVPVHTFAAALIQASAFAARKNAICNLNTALCAHGDAGRKVFELIDSTMNGDKCCEKQPGIDAFCYMCMDVGAPGKEIVILACQIVVYMTLVILTQYGLFDSLYGWLTHFLYKPPKPRINNETVTAEKHYVSKVIGLPASQITDAMLVNDVHKSYYRCLHPRKPFNPVKGISFSVRKGECFGLMGVNGSGKSTVFRMISGEDCITKGKIFANGHWLKRPRAKYLKSLGYCPHYIGLDEFLTGYQNLSLLLSLRGLSGKDLEEEVQAWIRVVGLEKHSDKVVKGYSGGHMRRLATAAALSLGAAVTLLDRPTAGVDVSARRRVWLALKKGLQHDRTVIITSHSMDETEALCDRIAIMSAGEIAALGSAATLKAAHGPGHAVVIKLAGAADSTDGIQTLKEDMQDKFDCSLRDEHMTMLYYHIDETMPYSELFPLLEELKRDHSELIEDYSVTETSLEEVFLSFAQPHSATSRVTIGFRS